VNCETPAEDGPDSRRSNIQQLPQNPRDPDEAAGESSTHTGDIAGGVVARAAGARQIANARVKLDHQAAFRLLTAGLVRAM